jgi:hypothetical protein
VINHDLHKKVADVITNLVQNNKNLRFDPACGGSAHLPFFLDLMASRESALSKVDLMLLIGDEERKSVKLVCEIEESGFHPTKIFGKVFSTAGAVMAKIQDKEKFALDKDGIFIQIISSDKIEEKLLQSQFTQKYNQGKRIETEIKKMLKGIDCWIKDYHLIYCKNVDLNNVSSEAYVRLKGILANL